MVMMIATEQAQSLAEFRQRALTRAIDAFERELNAAGFQLDPAEQLDLLEVIEKIELSEITEVVRPDLPVRLLNDQGGRSSNDTAALGIEPSPLPATTAADASESGILGLKARLQQARGGGGTVLDFGRYAGWTVGTLVDHDPDYLEWLVGTPQGRRLSAEIETAISGRAS